MSKRIEPLDGALASFVRASKVIGSFHTAVEEVLLNSIDAGSQRIDIYLDLNGGSFEVYDDGKDTIRFFTFTDFLINLCIVDILLCRQRN